MRLPERIKVGGFYYDVRTVTKDVGGEDRHGHANHAQLVIRVTSDYPDDQVANTLLHEVLHAIWYVWGLEDEDKEERVVNCLANGFASVLRDNPDLSHWLARSFK